MQVCSGRAADIRVVAGQAASPAEQQAGSAEPAASPVESAADIQVVAVAGWVAGRALGPWVGPVEQVAGRALGPAESVAALELVAVAALPVTDLRNCRKILLHHYLRNRN